MNTLKDILTPQEEQKIKKLEVSQKVVKVIGWCLFIAGLLITVSGIHNLDQIDATHLSQFGDFIGGTVGTLWTLIGFILIYMAFIGQQIQLINQKADLRETRKGFELQREQLGLQNIQIAKQIFENTFFQLLKLHNEVASNVEWEGVDSADLNGWAEVIPKPPVTVRVKGRDAFGWLHKDLSIAYRTEFFQSAEKLLQSNSELTIVELEHKKELWEGVLKSVWALFFHKYRPKIGHYFKTICALTQFIINSELNQNDKEKYLAILESQLSEFERVLLLYYASMSYRDEWGCKKTILNSGILANIDISVLLNPAHKQLLNDISPVYHIRQ